VINLRKSIERLKEQERILICDIDETNEYIDNLRKDIADIERSIENKNINYAAPNYGQIMIEMRNV